MDKHESIVYVGKAFTVEWYFDSNGNCQAYEYFLELDKDRRRKFLMLVKRIGDAGKINDKTKFRNEGDQIFAFKPQPDRYVSFFFTGKKIIVTNAFAKKSQKMPVREKQRSLEYKKDYEERAKEEAGENNI